MAVPSDRNILRYGGLDQVADILDERPPASMDEVRVILMNLIDNVRVMDKHLSRHEEDDCAHSPNVT